MVQLLSPQQLLDHLLDSVPASERWAVLTRARQTNEQLLQQLADERLAAEEDGWADHWQTRHTRTTDTLALITQALATC